MEDTRSKPDRMLLGIVALIAVLVIVALVVVFTRGAPQPLEEGTPQRAVQDYVTAVIDGDRDTALELLTPAWKEDCKAMDYGATTTDVRITLISTQVHERTATVTVAVAASTNSGPFGESGYEYEEAFQLERSGDDWLIASVPWELAICPATDFS
ncbi:MAG TPA: hypothetical protein VFT01_03555 [Homoserinimonas sp.]|nr:hypothetical protein [Homoserinimonas sp.]